MDTFEILKRCGTIAFVGCSKNENKPAHYVPKYMKAHGYTIIPVNPTTNEILGEKC
jgi:predicted CoA-binding protein